ncbi:GMC oxidoreductase domain-containing protein [Purpureocillium lilacinum]|uniref:GMC oxidoreductase domain-containing protein n=1 Tax=Purpureocillium lilacinum TaxID=33203 RepID=A0A179GX24_PURLI|nr:GMC oxidoreductase domain-containing protein [Purpureocillium lilacinum]
MWPMSFPYPERRPLDVAGRIYDYVIVGGGTAGCVLASRLSEDLSVSVLVLEKGYVRDHALSRIPTLSQDFSRNDLQVVKFKAEPVSEMPTDGGRQNVKEGIVLYGCDGLGGASRINGMMLTRGWVGEYQAWADDLGLDEWGWKDVEPSGIPLRPFTKHFAFYSYMERAMASLNLVKNEDINTSTTTAQGYYHTHTAVDVSGQRHTAYHGVMKKALRFCMRLSEAFMKSEGQVGDDKYPYLDRCSIFMGPGMDDGMGEYEASGTGRKTVKSRTAADVTDIELETFIYRWFGTGYHQAAERPFEKRINGRTGGVVDQHLRVFGVSGLRVADASIFPVIPSTHPMIPTMMVAERCARFLKSYE